MHVYTHKDAHGHFLSGCCHQKVIGLPLSCCFHLPILNIFLNIELKFSKDLMAC